MRDAGSQRRLAPGALPLAFVVHAVLVTCPVCKELIATASHTEGERGMNRAPAAGESRRCDEFLPA